jgi:hypothetical protein
MAQVDLARGEIFNSFSEKIASPGISLAYSGAV